MPEDTPKAREGTVMRLSITAEARVIKAADITEPTEEDEEERADG